ncbi:L,D-transpeptidase family protein [Microvirga flavescens]|uniref:L,D-transpeptidase family protein n=1 Tax=Microvirga flavescens TaxID=2249811 RepID=UPI000DDBECD4|nr:murein L,D-transpeptidase family protein [Microvirga flavescens]
MMKRFAMAASLALALAACQDESFRRSSTRHLTPIPAATMSLMASKGMSKGDPILIRAYKKEGEMEIWKRAGDGRYALLKTYPVCRWSGQLGPKTREGDRQVPEGFYTVTPAQMNPNSSYYLSFDVGYPNAYDRAYGRTGGDIMTHGSCSSRGCFAMTDEAIAEIYSIAREAFASGQRGFQFQSYPFRMNAQNFAQHRLDPNMAFWKNLKEGSDYFDVTHEEPRVSVVDRRYAFNVGEGSAVSAAVEQKRVKDEQEVAEVARGVQPVKLVYHDGSSHESFRRALAGTLEGGSLVVDARTRDKFGDVSRPEGLSTGPQEIALDASGKPKEAAVPATALAFAPAAPAPAPVAAAPAPVAETKLASTAPAASAPVQASAASGSQETPFYKKMFNGIGDLFSTSSTAEPVAETAQAAPVTTAPAAQVPKPPVKPQKRAEAATGMKLAQVRN